MQGRDKGAGGSSKDIPRPNGPTLGPAAIANVNQTSPSITSIVEKTLRIVNRKKFNVVVSGMYEKGSEDGDKALFADLCSRFLNITPSVTGCKRLGDP